MEGHLKMNKKLIKRFSCQLFTFLCILFLAFSLTACGEVKKKAPAKKADTNGEKVKGGSLEKGDDEIETNNESDPEENATPSLENEKEEGAEEKEDEAGEVVSDGDVIEINEKIFLQKINDIYFNFDDYANSTIIIEGMFSNFTNMDGTETRPVVYREGPGCCGNDGWGGFFLLYDGEYPNENDWIRVVGKPILTEAEGGYLELFLKVESLEVKKERGAEFVTH